MGLGTKTYWLTDRQSQCDFDFDFDFDNELVCKSVRLIFRSWRGVFMCDIWSIRAVIQWYSYSSCVKMRLQETTSKN
jgi:hypothetical protein